VTEDNSLYTTSKERYSMRALVLRTRTLLKNKMTKIWS